MEIFNWMNDIEKIYGNLIEKAREENRLELQELKKEQEKLIEDDILKKNKFIKENLRALSEKALDLVSTFQNEINEALSKMDLRFEHDMENLVNSVLKKLGFEF